MKRNCLVSILIFVLTICFALPGCSLLSSDDTSGDTNTTNDIERIGSRYSERELVAAAEALFDTEFDVVDSHEPDDESKTAKYTILSDDIPFEFNLYADYTKDRMYSDGEPSVVLVPHAYCDYYEKMMEYQSKAAEEIADELGLSVTIDGQQAQVKISGYEQLKDVYEYLEKTNTLYNFTVVESQLTGLLRDIRTRPTLSVILDQKTFRCSDEVMLLYYTINHNDYNYTKSALLPTMCEMYIEKLDSLSLDDPAVTKKIREEFVKPALTELRINGEPVSSLNRGKHTANPNFVFDYNWLLQGYYADVRMSAPADNYNGSPTIYGDDRNFKYLVELLGGTYISECDMQYNAVLSAYSSDWYLGGNVYTNFNLCQEYIPIESYFWINDEYLEVDCTYSKEMWGLENGYDPGDFYIRISMESFADILGVDIQANYEEGWLDLITPENYFELGDTNYIFPDDNAEPTANELVIPDGTTKIPDKKYRECKEYTSVVFPDGLKTIGNEAFAWCDNIKTIELPQSVKVIGDDAFLWCCGITSVTLPDGIETIGTHAFSMCKSLTEITIPGNVKKLGGHTFAGSEALQTVTISSGITELPDNMFLGCSSLRNVILPDTLTTINYRAFERCESLRTIVLPEGLTTIDYMAFLKCYSLEKVVIPESVTFIGQSAFSHCTVTIIAPHEPEYYGYIPTEGETWIVK
ncbi:MAG: leucine-rich repeat domain-containing protein [Clostridia bacterium]|nr:leucine-rich repeat domain-containing protein [Clostridia bacterium]